VTIDDILAKELGAAAHDELPGVLAALDLLSRLLTPEVSSGEAGKSQ
jgi:hypothetical protein